MPLFSIYWFPAVRSRYSAVPVPDSLFRCPVPDFPLLRFYPVHGFLSRRSARSFASAAPPSGSRLSAAPLLPGFCFLFPPLRSRFPLALLQISRCGEPRFKLYFPESVYFFRVLLYADKWYMRLRSQCCSRFDFTLKLFLSGGLLWILSLKFPHAMCI